MSPKCPLSEIYKQQNNQFTTDEACHVAVNMWGFKVSKEVICHVQLAETIRNRERFDGDVGKNIVQKEVG